MLSHLIELMLALKLHRYISFHIVCMGHHQHLLLLLLFCWEWVLVDVDCSFILKYNLSPLVLLAKSSSARCTLLGDMFLLLMIRTILCVLLICLRW